MAQQLSLLNEIKAERDQLQAQSKEEQNMREELSVEINNI